MAYKNWKREQGRINKAKSYIRNNVYGLFGWKYGVHEDWAKYLGGFGKYIYGDYGRRFFTRGSWKTEYGNPEDISFWGAEDINHKDKLSYAKKLTEKGSLLHCNKKWFRTHYNRRRRRIGKQYCWLAENDRLDEADHSLNQEKDKSYWWSIT